METPGVGLVCNRKHFAAASLTRGSGTGSADPRKPCHSVKLSCQPAYGPRSKPYFPFRPLRSDSCCRHTFGNIYGAHKAILIDRKRYLTCIKAWTLNLLGFMVSAFVPHSGATPAVKHDQGKPLQKMALGKPPEICGGQAVPTSATWGEPEQFRFGLLLIPCLEMSYQHPEKKQRAAIKYCILICVAITWFLWVCFYGH